MAFPPSTLPSPVYAGVPNHDDHAFNYGQGPAQAEVSPCSHKPQQQQPQCLQSIIHDENEETVGEYINNSDKLLLSFRNLFNNPEISDVTVVVGSEKYYAHRVILAHASDVFKVMLMSDKWKDADQDEIHLEEPQCEAVIGEFLEYIYTGKVHITTDKAVPLLILADKYNLPELKESCGAFMMRHLVTSPGSNHVLSWYQYAKTCGHRDLEESCNQFIQWNVDTIIGSPDWEMMDKDHLMSLLRSSDIVVKSEYSLYCALESWMMHSSRVEFLEENLKDLLPLIRFPVMTPQQLITLEGHELVQEHSDIYEKHFKRAFRFHAVPIDSRKEENFSRSRVYEFRNYTGVDHKIAASIIIQNYSSTSGNLNRVRHKQSLHTVISGSNADSHDTLNWEMTFYPKGFYRTADGFVVERNNAVRFLITLQNGTPMDMDVIHIVYSHQNKVTFVKDVLYHSHHFSSSTIFQIENLLPFDDLRSQDSPYLIENTLKIQVIIKPKVAVLSESVQNSIENST